MAASQYYAGIACYVVIPKDVEESDAVVKELKGQVRASIGAFATPDLIAVIPGLPKTRSGKIMRRILRKVAEKGEAVDREGAALTEARTGEELLGAGLDVRFFGAECDEEEGAARGDEHPRNARAAAAAARARPRRRPRCRTSLGLI